MENLFRLSRYSLRSKTGKIRHPHNTVIRESIGLYSTLEQTITAMQEIVATEDNIFTYCFYIKEFDFKQSYITIATERCYTKDGKLYDQYLKSENDRNFRGRHSKDIRFKEGDIVEVLQPNGVCLEMVTRAPYTKEEYRDRREWIKQNPKKFGKFGRYTFRLDKGDDCYCTISLGEGDTHSHPHSMTVFPVSKSISAKHRKSLLAKFAECCTDFDNDEDVL